MIRNEDITSFEGIPLAKYGAEEIIVGGDFTQFILEASVLKKVIVTDHPVCVLGVVRPTLIGTAHFWFLLCQGVHRADLRALKRYWPTIFSSFPRLQTGVEVGHDREERFARFFGFEPFGEPYDLFGRQYQSYEARN